MAFMTAEDLGISLGPPLSPAAAPEGGPKPAKARHYDVTEVRSFLRRRQEQRRRRRQEEEEASRARLAQIRAQVAALREQQIAALGGRKRRPANLNKTYVIESLNEQEHAPAAEEEEEPLDEDAPMIEDGPMTMEDLEVSCEEPGYRAPREKYQEVWPANSGPKARTPEPPQEIAGRLTALEESAALLQSRLHHLSQRFTPGQAASTASDEPPRTGLARELMLLSGNLLRHMLLLRSNVEH